MANKNRHSNNSNKNYYYSYNCCVTLLLGRYEEISTHPMLLCSNKILGDGESRHRVNDRHKCLGWNKQHTPFISGKESLMHPPHTKRRREATLEPGHCHGSLWLVQSSSLINQLKLLGPLGRCKLAHGEVNSMQAQVFMPRHVQTPFVELCFPHISTHFILLLSNTQWESCTLFWPCCSQLRRAQPYGQALTCHWLYPSKSATTGEKLGVEAY